LTILQKLVLTLSTLVAVSVAASVAVVTFPHTVASSPRFVQATWYGSSLAGNLTASGERFDPTALTAAHPNLPFGTRLLVKHEGREVTVKVNDRPDNQTELDLSESAAEQIGLKDKGGAPVEIQNPKESEKGEAEALAEASKAKPRITELPFTGGAAPG